MPITLALFAILIIGLSAYGVLLPSKATSLVRSTIELSGLWAAVAARVLLAILLWFSASVSLTPITFEVLAAIALAAAVALPIIGSERILKLVDWLTSWPPVAIRLQCCLGVAFGAFLLWSVSPGLSTL